MRRGHLSVATFVVCSVHTKHTAHPESMLGVLLKHWINYSHSLTSLISKWPVHGVIIFYPTSQQNTGEITSLMSSFHIGVISTSIALGPHINLLQEETTDWSLVHSNERKRIPCTFIERIYSRFLFLTSGSIKVSLVTLHPQAMCLKVTKEWEGSQDKDRIVILLLNYTSWGLNISLGGTFGF